MTKYRVHYRYKKWYPQYKGWFFWRYFYDELPCMYYQEFDVVCFDRKQDAQRYIQRLTDESV